MKQHQHTGIRGCTLLILIILGWALTPARADWEVQRIDALIAASDFIAVALVDSVRPPDQTGETVATLIVQESLHGDAPPVLTVTGHTTDPGRPAWRVGTRVIAFMAGAPGAPPSPVGLDQGVVEVSEDQLTPTRILVRTAVSQGSALNILDAMPHLAVDGGSVAPPILAAVLQQLSATTGTQDGPMIEQIACSPMQFRRPAVSWALSLVGSLRLPGGRPCLEQLVVQPDSHYVVEAIDALGEYGDRRTIGVLHQLVPLRPLTPFDPTDDRPVDDPGVGPDNDPDDTSNPVPDGREDTNEVPQPPPPEPPIGAGDEPDDDTRPDDDGIDDPGLPPGHTDEDLEVPVHSNDPHSRHVGGGVTSAAILALGKIGHPKSVRRLAGVAREGSDLGLHSSVVVALGLIATLEARRELGAIETGHPDPLVRTLAAQTLRRLQTQRPPR